MAGCKTSSSEVLKEESNTLIQRVIAEKTKIVK